MFAVSFFGHTYADINNTFMLQLNEETYAPGNVTPTLSTVNMVKCTADHFNFNEKVSQFFANINLQEAYCPPLNH